MQDKIMGGIESEYKSHIGTLTKAKKYDTYGNLPRYFNAFGF